jgi:hypothetical protein
LVFISCEDVALVKGQVEFQMIAQPSDQFFGTLICLVPIPGPSDEKYLTVAVFQAAKS